jgi:hypothetical protein
MRETAGRSDDKPKLNLEEAVRGALAGLRYGSVEITVHNARVVQIERKERFRPEDEGFEGTLPAR